MRIILIVIAVATIGFVMVYIFYYNKPHRDIKGESSEYELTVDDLFERFIENEPEANAQFHDKVITVEGRVNQIIDRGDFSILLIAGEEGIVNCEINERHEDLIKRFQKNEKIRVKGLFIGYNDLLEEIQFRNCMIQEP